MQNSAFDHAQARDRRTGGPETFQGNPFCIELALDDAPALGLEWNYTDRAERLYQTGHRLLGRGFFGEAAELFERATCYDRAHYAAYVGRSEALILLGRTEEAAQVSDQAMARYGRNCALGAARGHVFLHQDDLDHAFECVDIATANDPESAYAWLVAGEARLALNKAVPFAMACFARGRAAADPWPLLDLRIALAFLEWGHADHARRALEAIAKARPDLPLAWILLGDAHKVEGNRRQSRACYLRAAELVPELQSVRRALTWKARLAEVWSEFRRALRSALAPP